MADLVAVQFVSEAFSRTCLVEMVPGKHGNGSNQYCSITGAKSWPNIGGNCMVFCGRFGFVFRIQPSDWSPVIQPELRHQGLMSYRLHVLEQALEQFLNGVQFSHHDSEFRFVMDFQ